MTTRAYNFCAGPAALPEEVLKQAQAELGQQQCRRHLAPRHFAQQVGKHAAQADHAQHHQRCKDGAGELGTEVAVQLRHRACVA